MTPCTPSRASRSARTALALLLISGYWPARAADAPNLPDLGEDSGALFSPQQERKLGDDFMREARTQLDLLEDAEVGEYLQRLGRGIAQFSDRPASEFRLFVVNDPRINAFAVPGGYIGVHTGLILAARNESELAGVLAHEITHITQRHIPRLIAQSERMTGPALAALLAAIVLAGASRQGQVGEAAIAMTAAGLQQSGLNFSRGFEQEADRIGITLLARAGYEPSGMPDFFERMQTLTRASEGNLPEFLRTHPVTTRRIAESRDHAETMPRVPARDGTEFFHAQARVRALGPESPAALAAAFAAALDNGTSAHRQADRYGLAIAAARAKQFDRAREEISALRKAAPNYLPYRLAAAEIDLAAGSTASALRALEVLSRAYPDHAAVAERYAAALMASGAPARARDVLQKAVRQHPDSAHLYRLLAAAAGEAHSLMESHRAMAEHYYLLGNPQRAVEQLRLALQHSRQSFYHQASIEARIREIEDAAGLPPTREGRAPTKRWG